MKRIQIKTRAGQYTFLQVLALVISGAAYILNSMPVVMGMVVVATIFGILAMMARIQEAKRNLGPQMRNRRRR